MLRSCSRVLGGSRSPVPNPNEELALTKLRNKKAVDRFSLTLEEVRELKQLLWKKWRVVLNQAEEEYRKVKEVDAQIEQVRERIRRGSGKPMICEEAYGDPSNVDMETPSQIAGQLKNLSV